MIAFIFPGQGSQKVGMGKALADAFPICRETFDEADAALGDALSRIIFEGPEDQLTLSPQLELYIYSRSDRWVYLLNSMNLEERASLEERLWGIQSWERAPAPALSDAVAAAAERLSIKSA